MIKQLLLVFTMLICLQAPAADVTTAPDKLTLESPGNIAISPELLALAKAIVSDMVKDKTPDEVLNMVNEIALALSKEKLCGIEAIQSMLDVGIPFEMAYASIVKSCNLAGPALAALNRSLAPGASGHGGTGGPGGEVSP